SHIQIRAPAGSCSSRELVIPAKARMHPRPTAGMTDCSTPLSACDLCPELVFLFSQIRREFITEILGLGHLSDLDLGVLERRPSEPRYRFIPRLHLPDPEACNQLLGLGEWPVDDRSLAVRELHAGALRTGEESVTCEHHASFHELFVERTHPCQHLTVRHDAGFGVAGRLYDDHESHCPDLLLLFVCVLYIHVDRGALESTRSSSDLWLPFERPFDSHLS